MMGSTYNRKTKIADVTERKVQRPRDGRGNKGRTVDPGTESEDTRDDEESKKGKTDRTDKKKVKERVSQDSRDSGSRKSKILSVRAGSTAARTDINKSSKSYHSSGENINLDLDLDPSSNITDSNFATNTINNQKSRNSRQKKSTIDEKDSDRSDKGKEEKERTDDSSNNNDHRNHDTNKDKELQSEKVQKKSEAFQVGISLKSNLRLDSALNLNLISAERFNLFHDKKDENRDKKIDIDNEFYSFY